MKNQEQYKDWALLAGVALSTALLLFFLLINTSFEMRAAFKMPTAWIIVALVPTIIGLILSGRIQSFKFGQFEAVMTKSVFEFDAEQQIISFQIVESPSKISKGPLRDIKKAFASRPDRLRLHIDKANGYERYAVSRYLCEIPSIKFIEIVDKENRLLCLFPLSLFMTNMDRLRMNPEDNRSIRLLLELVQHLSHADRIHDDFVNSEEIANLRNQGVVPTITVDTELRSVIRELRRSEFVAIVDKQGVCTGVVTWRSLGDRLASLLDIQGRA